MTRILGDFPRVPPGRVQAQAAVSQRRWLQVVTLLVGLSKLSSVT